MQKGRTGLVSKPVLAQKICFKLNSDIFNNNYSSTLLLDKIILSYLFTDCLTQSCQPVLKVGFINAGMESETL